MFHILMFHILLSVAAFLYPSFCLKTETAFLRFVFKPLWYNVVLFYLLFCLCLNIVCRSVLVLGSLQIHDYRHLKFDTFVYFFSSIIYVKLGINDWYNVVSFYSITPPENVFMTFADSFSGKTFLFDPGMICTGLVRRGEAR